MSELLNDAISLIREEIKQGSLSAALDHLSQAFVRHGDAMWLLVQAHEVYSSLGQHYTALLYAERLIQVHSDVYHGYARVAQQLARLDRLDDARTMVQQSVQRFPREYWMLIVGIDVLREAGDLKSSIAYCQDLRRYHPDQPLGYSRGAELLLRLRQLDEARVLIEDGLQRFPDNLALLLAGHDLHRLQDQPEQALPLAQRVISCFPAQAQGYERAALDCIALKRFDEAVATIRDGLRCASERQQLLHLQAYAGQFVLDPARSYNLQGLSSQTLSMRSVIAYAHLPGFFSDLLSLRSSDPRSSRQEGQDDLNGKSLLFVAGLGRSGTSALCKLLNLSHRIELYTELYDPSRVNGYQAVDFASESLKVSLQSHPHLDDRSLFDARHSGSLWIGDKRPNFQFCLESTYENVCSRYRMQTIFIHRDLRSVLRSVHRRSEDSRDSSWGLEQGIEYTVLLYNATIYLMLDLYRRRPEVFRSILFVRYEEVFAGSDVIQSVWRSLGVELLSDEQSAVAGFLEASARHVHRSDPRDELSCRIDAVVERYLDRGAQLELASVAGLDLGD